MKHFQNEGSLDRFVRIIASKLLFLAGFFWLGGTAQIIIYIFSAIFFITALTGFCGLYTVCKIRTNQQKLSKIWTGIFIALFLIIAIAGSFYSNFFTKKFFLEDYNQMNQYYKQTLFQTGQNNRTESLANYSALITEYAIFSQKYTAYHPYVLKNDTQLNTDLQAVSTIIARLKEKVSTGDLKEVHLSFEAVRPIFQGILKRNNFSMLAVSLVDFHDAMEKVIDAADAKNSADVLAVYPEVSEKLQAVESAANDAEIQEIRKNLEAVKTLAEQGQSEKLSAKATELKKSFIKVYLQRG